MSRSDRPARRSGDARPSRWTQEPERALVLPASCTTARGWRSSSLTAVAVFLLFPAPRLPDTAVLERGVVAPHDVIAEFPFDIPKSARRAAPRAGGGGERRPAGLRPRRPQRADSVVAGGARASSPRSTRSRASRPGAPARDALRAFMEQNRISPTPSSLDAPAGPGRRRARCSGLHRARCATSTRAASRPPRWARASPPCASRSADGAGAPGPARLAADPRPLLRPRRRAPARRGARTWPSSSA